MSLINTKILLAILAATVAIGAIAGRLQQRMDRRDAVLAQFHADVQEYAKREGYSLGQVSKTIRRMPR